MNNYPLIDYLHDHRITYHEGPEIEDGHQFKWQGKLFLRMEKKDTNFKKTQNKTTKIRSLFVL